MKNLGKFLVIVVLLSLLAGCSGGAPAATQPPAVNEPPAAVTEPPAAEVPLTEQEQWLKDNLLGQYDTGGQDWAAIEEAAKKEGSLLVYANTSKISKAAEAFMEEYPEIKMEGFDLGGDDVVSKVVGEQQSGAFTGDVWFSSGGAELIGNIMPHQYVWRFVPAEMNATVSPEHTQPLLVSRFGTRVLAYNKELNDSCPVTNLWQLTDPEWKGKVFIEDPLNDESTLSILLTIVSKADEMKAAYVELYGSEPVLDEDTPDAGWLWFKRFAQNGPIPEPGGDEVDSAFATPGMKDSYVAFTSYSNYADVLEGALAFEPCWGAKPVIGVQNQSYVGVLNQAPHPNAAKLFIRFVTSEGRDPWAKFGTYFPDTTYEVPEGMKTLDEIRGMVWLMDEQFAYDNLIQGRDFYLLNLAAP